MSGTTDFLFNGQTPPAVTSESNAGSSLPLWYSSYLSTLADNAANIASQPYQPYGGTRIMPQDPQETRAYTMLDNRINQWRPAHNAATQQMTNLSGGFNQGAFDQYMSPYMSGVVDEIGRLGMRNMNENLMPALQDQFVSSGQFGSDRNMEMATRLARDVGADITGQQGMALQGAHANAMGNYLAGTGHQINAAQQLGGLAQQNLMGTIGSAGALSASGATNRAFGQANADLAYQDFQNQMNYPRQNVSFLNSVLHGTQVPTSQDSVSSAPYQGVMGPSPLQVFGGLTMAGIGMGGGYARGGRVKYARGGLEGYAGGGDVVRGLQRTMRRRASPEQARQYADELRALDEARMRSLANSYSRDTTRGYTPADIRVMLDRPDMNAGRIEELFDLGASPLFRYFNRRMAHGGHVRAPRRYMAGGFGQPMQSMPMRPGMQPGGLGRFGGAGARGFGGAPFPQSPMPAATPAASPIPGMATPMPAQPGMAPAVGGLGQLATAKQPLPAPSQPGALGVSPLSAAAGVSPMAPQKMLARGGRVPMPRMMPRRPRMPRGGLELMAA